jgi:hypothetical protein
MENEASQSPFPNLRGLAKLKPTDLEMIHSVAVAIGYLPPDSTPDDVATVIKNPVFIDVLLQNTAFRPSGKRMREAGRVASALAEYNLSLREVVAREEELSAEE